VPARLAFLRALYALYALCAMAEDGAGVGDGAAEAACVAAVLHDAQARLCVFGGRAGLVRSLGSVYAGSVVRFLGGRPAVASRVIPTPGLCAWLNGMALSRDGATLLAAHGEYGNCVLRAYDVTSGALLREVGGWGTGPLQFGSRPHQIWVAPDDFVFVADLSNHRIQVLTPQLTFHAFLGVGELSYPEGVCADRKVVVVCESGVSRAAQLLGVTFPVVTAAPRRISVFRRSDGALLRRFASGCPQLGFPRGLCFTSRQRHVAVVDMDRHCVFEFSLEGELVRTVGSDVLKFPVAAACLDASDELVVADQGSVLVFNADGELLRTLSPARDVFACLAVHGGTIFALACHSEQCVVFA
jgi:hypothetical protein